MDAILYVDRTGIAWRYMPHDFPPWETVYGYFAAWQNEGVFDQLNGLLRRLVREAEGRDGEPRAFLFGLGDQIVGAVAFDITGGKIATVRVGSPSHAPRLPHRSLAGHTNQTRRSSPSGVPTPTAAGHSTRADH